MKFIKPNENKNCENLLQCIFQLNELDINVYKKLNELGEARADTLAKKINKERSTIYRSLQKLTSCGICTKKTKTIETGGYYHTYLCHDTKQVKIKIETCLDEWYKQMKNSLKDFEKNMG